MFLNHNSFQTKEDWCERWTRMAANLNVLKNYKIAFYPNQKFLLQKFIAWTAKNDVRK